MHRLILALLLGSSLSAQTLFTMPTDGSMDTSTNCTGFLVDGGGINGNYNTYDDGYFVIDPPGNATVSVTFSSFSTYHSLDRVYIYDGVGTSGTFLGSYYGSSLPNSGNAITSTSGAITLRFYSNYYGVSTGFLMSWSTNATTAPNASISATSTSVSYNSPVQFINTSTNAGNYLWDFGDGNTSTDANPQHSYTSSGTKTVTMIAENCYSADTATMTITVGAAPNGSYSNDSIILNVPCGTTASGTWTLSNASGAGNLIVATELIDTNYIFKADFEDGTLETFTTTSTNATLSNTSSTAHTGSRSLAMNGYYNSAQTVNAGWTTSQPTRISYATKVNASQGSSGYTWISGSTGNTIGYSPFGYTYWYTTSLRIIYRTNTGYTTTYYHYTTANEWVNVEYDNIDWTNGTFDLVVDGTVVATNAQFYYTSATNTNGIHGYQYSTAYVHYLDDVEVQGGTALDVTYSPANATISGGNNVVFNFTVDASNLYAGSYYLELALTSNDTSINGLTIPVIVNVTGDGVWETNYSTCTSISGYTGAVNYDTLKIWNSGCDTLIVSNISHSNSRISGSTAGFTLAPDDTISYGYSWSCATAGTFGDTIYFTESDSTYAHCISATVQDAASIAVDSTVFNISYTGCPDSLLVPFWIYNDGQQTLNWGTNSIGGSIFEDFEDGTTMNTSLWSYFGSGANIQPSTYGCGVINGSYSLHFYGGTRYAATQPLNLSSGGTISFELDQGYCDNAESSEGVYLQYSTDGVYWNNIQYFYTYSSMTCTATIPTAAMTSSTQLRLYQIYNSGSSFDAWIIDDFYVDAGMMNNLAFSPDTGNVSVGDSQLVYVVLHTDSLEEGLHTYEGFISSNDPVDSIVPITVNLLLDGVSETSINRYACLNLDTIVKNSTTIDSIMVMNTGCDSLVFGTITTTSSAFTTSTSVGSFAAGDTGYVVVSINPTSTGTIQDTVYVVTSDTTWPVCYSGYVAEAPSAWVQTSPINISTQNCGDSVNFNVLLGNTAANTNMNWSISSGEVLNILLVNSNVYPSLWNNFQTYLATVENVAIKTVTTTSAVPGELAWADIVIFPPVTNSSASSDYTSIQTDMSDWINDGGKMLVMGSAFVDNILAMNFITGYYYGNYTGYTHYVNSGYYNHPYVQGVSTSFVPQSAALDAYIYNTGYVYLVYNTYYRQALSYFPLGDGEVIYYGFNFNTVYADMTKILDNIFESTLSDKATGVNWLSFNPTSGSTSGGDTTTISGTAYSDTLAAGVYNMNINITTNDPTNPSFSIPVTFTVNGQGEGMLDNSCVNFGSVYQNMTHNEDVPVYNVGCDTLFISSASTGGSAFTAGSVSLAIAPGDTGMVPVSLYQTSLGTVNDTLYVYSSVDTVQRCLTANIVGASDISVAPSSIEVTINKCNGFATVPYTITNNGQAQLSYAVDVAEIYDSSYTQTWLYPAPNYSNTLVYNFNNIIDSDTIFYEIILNGEYSQTNNYFYLYANGSYVQTVYDNNVSNYINDTISGFITGWQLTNIMNAGYLTIQLYSYNYNSVSGQTCQVHVWQRDDVTWASPVGVATGTLAAGNSVSKSILVTVSNLALGTYYTSVVFETNDPQDPMYQVPMTVHVVSEPDMVLGANAINYGNVYNTNPVVDSVLIENDGCTNLTISNVSSNNSHFVPNWTNQTITPGSSQWLHVTFTATASGTQSGLLTISNNDSLQVISLSANVIFAPTADFQYQVQNVCNGTVSFTNESSNGSQYQWDFGDGQFSGAVNPQHTYNKPGTYSVMLVTSNSGGSDTTFKTVILNDVLYVASEFPDTVQAGTTVQFIDSSMYANSWQWYFGDGNNSTTPNPQHTYQNKGTFIVTLLVTNSAGCSGSTNNAIIVTSGIGIREQALEAALYPNPTSGSLHIECSAAERIILYSSTGAQILDIPFVEDLDLSNLPAGSYQIVLLGNSGLWRETISVVR